jgi:hypothetical protein
MAVFFVIWTAALSGATPKPKATAPPASGQIKFIDLVAPEDDAKPTKPQLPYGQEFTIQGNTNEVCIGGKTVRDASDASKVTCNSGHLLYDIMDATDVQVEYTGNGKNSAKVSGGAWSVTINKLDANTPASFKFTFSGKLSSKGSASVLDTLVASKKFQDSLDQFTTAARGKTAAEQAPLASAFGGLAAEQVLDAVSATTSATPANADTFRKTLSSGSFSTFAPIFNLAEELQEVIQQLPEGDLKVLQIAKDMTPSQLYKQLTEDAKKGIADSSLKKQVASFLAFYETDVTQFQINVSADLTVGAQANADDVAADLKKYAGFDVGALYAPRLNELRSFATVNIYFGSVALHPEKGTRLVYWERLSLTFGMALKDVSGNAASKISGENAFVYGLGFRLNKYFRITTGGMVYRTSLPAVNGVASPLNNKLRQEFFIGPSIDITALPALEGIFGKKQSN